MLELSVVRRQPPRAISGSSASVHSCSPAGAREFLAHDGGVVGMQVNLDVARRQRQQAHGVPDDADDLRGIDLELAPHQVLGDGQRQAREFGFDRGVELVERPRQRADDGLERRDLDVHFGDALGEFRLALAHAFDVAVLVAMFPGLAFHQR